MKKILFAAVALVAISFASCTGCVNQLNDELQKAADSLAAADSLSAAADSASYAIDEADAALDSVEAFVEE